MAKRKNFYSECEEIFFAQIESPDKNSRDTCLRSEVSEEILKIISDMNTYQREAITLRFFSGFDYAEIAKIMDVPSGSVGVLISRGLEKLKQKLHKDFYE